MSTDDRSTGHGAFSRLVAMMLLAVLLIMVLGVGIAAQTDPEASKNTNERSSGPADSLPVPTSDTLTDDGIWIVPEVYPELAKEAKPEYPRRAIDAGMEGTVWVKALVDKQGKVAEAHVFASSGYKELDEAATEGAFKNKFKPGLRLGKPVFVWVVYKVDYRIR